MLKVEELHETEIHSLMDFGLGLGLGWKQVLSFKSNILCNFIISTSEYETENQMCNLGKS